MADTSFVEATSAPRPHGLRIPKPKRLLSTFSDERLVDHVLRGDAAAFEVLYDRHSAGVLGFCRHMLGSVADAEDAVQHTFLAAHVDIARAGKRDLHVKAWLYTIARNRCLSVLRARREQPSDELVETGTDNLLPAVEQREEIRALLGDVAKLPDDQREALVLSELGDLSHADISEVLGCEVSKVKSLVFQARSALIDRRAARDTSCEEIREQLATLRGGALRRTQIRHHLESCPGCSAYRDEVRRQRAMLAVALPIVPSVALKAKVLGAAGLTGSGAAAGAAGGIGAGAGATASAGGIAGVVAQGGLAKIAVAVAIAATGAGGAAIAHNGGLPFIHESSAAKTLLPPTHTTSRTSVAHTGTAFSGTTGSHRSASGTAHGFTPTTGQSNGAAARQFAATRGKGKHTGTIIKHHKKGAHTPVRTVTPPKRTKPAHVKSTPAPRTSKPAPNVKTRTQPTHTAPTHTTPKGKTTDPVGVAPPPTTTAPPPTTTAPTTTAPGLSTTGTTGGKALGNAKNLGSAAG